MLTGSLKERSLTMKQVDMDLEDEVCINVYHKGVKISERVLRINGTRVVIPAEKDKEIRHSIDFAVLGGGDIEVIKQTRIAD